MQLAVIVVMWVKAEIFCCLVQKKIIITAGPVSQVFSIHDFIAFHIQSLKITMSKNINRRADEKISSPRYRLLISIRTFINIKLTDLSFPIVAQLSSFNIQISITGAVSQGASSFKLYSPPIDNIAPLSSPTS
jgi:hypothetical protein